MTHKLVHVEESTPGITRRRAGRGFVYLDPSGRRLTNQAAIDRIKSLAIPPAWTDVWICLDADGHIQATGRDVKGRKQYRYHDQWNELRSVAKFDSLLAFGRSLPTLRADVERAMRCRTLSFDRVVATTVWLLDHTLIRIGNREYSDSSYGLTTLRAEHAEAATAALRLRFVGKSGREHDVTVRDAKVARVVRQCQELPGQRLLQYLDGDVVRPVESHDVNEYLRAVTSTDFTAKTFRTWGASAHAAQLLAQLGPPGTKRQATSDARDVIRETATLLRNTPAVCRNSYVHPAVLTAHESGQLHELRPSMRRARWLAPAERRLLTLLDTNDAGRLDRAG
jgi:DNA topoisomerase-1